MSAQQRPSGPHARTAVVVVNYGACALIERNAGVFGDHVDFIVVDNFSSDAERQRVRAASRRHGWDLIESTNRGFAHGCNVGVNRARTLGCEVVLLLNPDAQVTAATLDELVRSCVANPSSIASPSVVDSTGKLVFKGAMINLRTGAIRSGWNQTSHEGDWWNWLFGACLAVSVETYERVGGMPEGYFLYFEDVDFSITAQRMGVELIWRDDLRAIHDEGGTQVRTSVTKSNIYYRYNARNRLVFGARHAPRDARAGWVLSTPRESLAIWLRGGRRQLLSRPSSVAAVVRGTIEGLWLFGSELRRKEKL